MGEFNNNNYNNNKLMTHRNIINNYMFTKDKNVLDKRSSWPKDIMLKVFKELQDNTPNTILSK